MSVRELFRRKLGKADVSPSSSFQDDLMRRLARREFMHFIPTKFNIYYLGAIAAGVAAAGLLIFGTSSAYLQKSRDDATIKPDSVSEQFFYIRTIPPIRVNENKVEVKGGVSAETEKTNTIIPSKGTSLKDRDSGFISGASVTGVFDSMKNKGLFSSSSPESMKLKESIKEGSPIFKMSVSNGCAPLRVHFTISEGSYDSCRWTFGDGGWSNETNPDWIYDVDGEYRVSLHVFRRDGYQASSSALVRVFPKPRARFEISPQQAVIPDDRIRFLNYSSDAVRFKWDFGDGDSSVLFEPIHKYSVYNNYNVSLVAYSEAGCTDSITVQNAFSDSKYFIEFPNAFIPNSGGSTGGLYSLKSDEVAQVFHPVYSGVAEYQLKIFSKLGVLIFESNDINIGWDGYYKGQLCNAGVYIWKVRGAFINGEPFVSMGDVTLLKNQ
jgi:PKD repeat protein